MKKRFAVLTLVSMFLLSSCAIFIYDDDDDADRSGYHDDKDTLMIIYSAKAGNPVLP